MVIACCIDQSVKSGVGSERLEIIGSIAAALGISLCWFLLIFFLASQNPQIVSGKIIARLLKVVP